jgi:hypothetical protein
MLLLAACAQTPVARYDALRRACDADEGEPIPWAVWGEVHRVIPARCAEKLGEVVSLDWNAFGDVPHDLEAPSYAPEWQIGGLFVLVASELGTVGELDASLVDGELLAAEFPDGLLADGWTADDPAGAFWLAYLDDRFDATLPSTQDNCTMAFGDGNLYACVDSNEYRLEHPVLNAGILMHEAGHRNGPSHLEGYEGYGADAGIDGTYALAARWLNAWFTHESRIPAEELEFLEREIDVDCYHIVDPTGFPPCEGA